MPINQQILLDNRPQGEAVASNFKLVSAETLRYFGQVLVRHHTSEPDLHARPHEREKSYAASQPLGKEVMIGGTVGEVVESRNANFTPWATRWWAWAAGRSTAWWMQPLVRCARSIRPMCRCRTTWAPSACPA